MTDGRLFTDAELVEMGTLTVDAVQKALDAGDIELAKKLNRRMYKEFLSMHDLFRDWVTGLLSFVYREHGDEELERALRSSVSDWLRPFIDLYQKEPNIRRQAQMLAAGLRGHLQPQKIEEDDEKFTFIMQPCGSGGRLILDGRYEGEHAFAKVAEPQTLTYGRENQPIYCTHCPFQELLAIEWTGNPMYIITELGEPLGVQPCKAYLYKDPAKIPAKYYERVGKQKPK